MKLEPSSSVPEGGSNDAGTNFVPERSDPYKTMASDGAARRAESMPVTSLSSPVLPEPVLSEAAPLIPMEESKVEMIQPQTKPLDTTAAARAKVEKLKNLPQAVIGGAATDPSLRFILMVAALFVVFVIILFISNRLR